jgi:hypothetical protein|nr:MAG TPA: hypothetical protein [Caudoviricetes sp.]
MLPCGNLISLVQKTDVKLSDVLKNVIEPEQQKFPKMKKMLGFRA